MKTWTVAKTLIGWFVVCPAWAQLSGVEAEPREELILQGGLLDNADADSRFGPVATSHRLSMDNQGAIWGYMALPKEPVLGVPASYLYRFLDTDYYSSATVARHWIHSTKRNTQLFTLGYVWRGLKLEGAAFSGVASNEGADVRREMLQLDARSTRLSFHPAPDWVFQIGHGSLRGLEQLEPTGSVRRTMIAATYQHAFNQGRWRTTLAWGRNAKKQQEATVGYLMESTLKFSRMHAVFGRIEQVGSDELMRTNDAMPLQMFKLNKFTLGYYRDVQTSGPLQCDVGALLTKYFMPSAMVLPYGNDPITYMMFIRLKVQ